MRVVREPSARVPLCPLPHHLRQLRDRLRVRHLACGKLRVAELEQLHSLLVDEVHQLALTARGVLQTLLVQAQLVGVRLHADLDAAARLVRR